MKVDLSSPKTTQFQFESDSNSTICQLLSYTPQQAVQWVEESATDLDSTKQVLKTLTLLLLHTIHKEPEQTPPKLYY